MRTRQRRHVQLAADMLISAHCRQAECLKETATLATRHPFALLCRADIINLSPSCSFMPNGRYCLSPYAYYHYFHYFILPDTERCLIYATPAYRRRR